MESSLNTREQELDSFQFNEAEENLIKDLVHSTETNIAELNLKIYNLNYDLSQINEALVQRDKLNLEDVDRVFSEAEIHFPDQLKRDYLALLAFRKKITAERRRELRKRSKEIEIELEIAAAQKAQLDTLRHSNVDAITSDDTIQKFKALQKNLREERIRYERRREDYERLKDLAEASRAHREKQRERDSLADEVGAMIEASTPQLEKFQRYFDQYCQTVLGLEGIFTLTANKYGNLEYEIGLGLDDKKGVTSSQGDGTSYRKITCALFDLALIRSHEGQNFFNFVYHDGVLEGLDDRKKQKYLSLVRSEVNRGPLQYILTAISSDLPRDQSGNRTEFSKAEVVLSLDDSGDAGRLFIGPAF